ncbi:MAG: hypothetical protein QNJ57_11085 [Flavobacteriaceae bacterium]|nr:hypothetical protein [Flavobacteriaceae bacterium]
MKSASSFLILLLILLIGCKSESNDPEFLAKFSGRYLYTDDETIKVHAKDGKLLIDWRGATNLAPMKVNENTFYVKDMNAKIQFLTNPDDGKDYLVFVPKEKDQQPEFRHVKVANDFKTPWQLFVSGAYKEALEGYLNIQKNDSLSPIVEEWRLNRKGYDYLEDKDYEKALEAFKINIELYPNSINVYDSYAEALYTSGDTANAITNYQKVLSMDSGNRHAKRQLERLQKNGDSNKDE